MVLRLANVTAGYGAKTVISGVSFALEPGRFWLCSVITVPERRRRCARRWDC
jgi:hypothetical protein